MKVSDYIDKKFKRGEQVGTLKKTLVERGKNYKWVEVIAFLDSCGKWLYSECWRLNQGKKATEIIKSLGYEEIIK